MQVKELMKQPFVVDKDISLTQAAKIMSNKGIGSLLFVTRGKAKGILTERDLLKNYGARKKVSQVMSKNILSTKPAETIEGVLRTMRDNKVKRLPVVDEKKNLIGIISLTDIAANFEKLDGEFFFQ